MNKNITNIQYNSLNLPSKVTLSSSRSITSAYNAAGVKRQVTYQEGSTQSTIDYCRNVIYEKGALAKILTDEGYITFSGTTPIYHYYLKDHLGNNRVVMNQDGSTVKQLNHYYPFGGLFDQTAETLQAYKYNGKELDRKYGLDLYDYSARYMDGALGRFTTMDPLTEKYYSMSPYGYCGNNPVNAIDPDGRSTWVMSNSDGTYRVVGGDEEDDDKNIYTYTLEDGNMVRGKSIGVTTSITSFYDSDLKEGKGDWRYGSIIDPNDNNGDRFLGDIFKSTPPMFDKYLANAGNGKKYDFKATNGSNKVIYDESGDYYRGMPVGKNKNGQTIYTSARDVGNIAAGYVAGVNGLSWADARLGFDGYQSIVKGRPAMEGISSQNAQYYGWVIGSNNTTPYQKLENLKRSVNSGLGKVWNWLIK